MIKILLLEWVLCVYGSLECFRSEDSISGMARHLLSAISRVAPAALDTRCVSELIFSFIMSIVATFPLGQLQPSTWRGDDGGAAGDARLWSARMPQAQNLRTHRLIDNNAAASAFLKVPTWGRCRERHRNYPNDDETDLLRELHRGYRQGLSRTEWQLAGSAH